MRLIDADALIKAINQTCSLKVVSIGNLVDIIGKQPTVDLSDSIGLKRKDDDRTCATCKHYDNGWDDAICDGCTTADDRWERTEDA